MAPLIQNMAWKDAQWSKFKRDYMWNNVYHLRRTKFAVYQLATTSIGVAHALSDVTLKHYSELSKKDIPGFPDARFRTGDIIGTIAFNIISCSLVAVVFTAGLFFDLFWPERVESRLIQRSWKFCAALTSLLLLIGLLTATIVIGSHQADIRGVSLKQESVIRESWSGTPLVYHQYSVAVAAVVVCWIGWVFTLWSTIVMWQSYAHNNTQGPFTHHNTRR